MSSAGYCKDTISDFLITELRLFVFTYLCGSVIIIDVDTILTCV